MHWNSGRNEFCKSEIALKEMAYGRPLGMYSSFENDPGKCLPPSMYVHNENMVLRHNPTASVGNALKLLSLSLL